MSNSKFHLDGFFNIDENRYTSTTLSFKCATSKSDYIRILRLCDGEPKTLKEIYPNVKSAPFADTVVALAKQGYLQKCTKEKYVYHLIGPMSGRIYTRYRKVWYYTTTKGRELVGHVLSVEGHKKVEEKTPETKTAADSAWQDMFAESMEAFASAMDAFSMVMSAYKDSLSRHHN